MTDVQWIFIVLAVLYVIESLRWVREGDIAFPRLLGVNRSPDATLRILGNERGELIISGLLPSDATFIAPQFPLSMGDAGASNFVRAAPLRRDRIATPNHFLNWEQAESVVIDQHRLLQGGTLLCNCHSAIAASAIRDALQSVALSEGSDRQKEIEAILNAGFDPEAVRQRIDDWFRATRTLRFAATLLFVAIFPVGIARYLGFWIGPINEESLLWYLGITLLIWWWNVALTYRAHSKLYRNQVGKRIGLVAKSMVSPIVPLRTADTLAQDLFSHVHPLAFAAAVNSQDADDATTQQIAAASVRDLLFPLLPVQPADAEESQIQMVDQHHQRTTQQIEELADSLGLDYEAMFAPPEAIDSMSQSYCPRCQQEFTVKTTTCQLCGGRETSPLA